MQTLAMGHQADPAHYYKFHIIQPSSSKQLLNIILGLVKMTKCQDRFLAIHVGSIISTLATFSQLPEVKSLHQRDFDVIAGAPRDNEAAPIQGAGQVLPC
jgi:hypothetical protein